MWGFFCVYKDMCVCLCVLAVCAYTHTHIIINSNCAKVILWVQNISEDVYLRIYIHTQREKLQ